jgi:CBS domain-containing protein
MRRVHRLVVVEGGKAIPNETDEERIAREESKGKLLGIISLSDILRHVIVGLAASRGMDFSLQA